MIEFPDQATPRPDGDPAHDPPLTVRVQGGHDRTTRLFDPHARRAVRTTAPGACRWFVVAGPGTPDFLTDEQVRDWTVVPAVFATVPWTIDRSRRAPAARVEPAGPLVGDMDVEAFRG